MTVLYNSPTIVITQDGISGNRANAFIAEMQDGVAATAADAAQTALDRAQTGLDVAASSASAGAAAASATASATSATQAALYDGPKFDTADDLRADTTLSYIGVDPVIVGQQIGVRYDGSGRTAVASGAIDYDTATAGGVRALANVMQDGNNNVLNYDGADLAEKIDRALKAQMTGEYMTDIPAIIIPPGEYATSSAPIIVNGSGFNGLRIVAHGARITHNASYDLFQVSNSLFVRWEGGHILAENSPADQLFNVGGGASYFGMGDMSIICDSANANFAMYRARQSNVADPNTGNFWADFRNIMVRKRSSGVPRTIPRVFDLIGAQNAAKFSGVSMSTFDKGVCLSNDPGYAYVPNGISMANGCAFENGITAISIDLASVTGAPNLRGPSVMGCRFENLTNVISLTGIRTQPANTVLQPANAPYFAGNQYVGPLTTFANNPDAIRLNVLDSSQAPGNIPSELNVIGPMRIRELSGGSAVTLEVTARTGGSLRQRDDAGVNQGGISLAAGSGLAMDGGQNQIAKIKHIKSISGTDTYANVFRGVLNTPASGTTVAVTFATAEPDASYYIIPTALDHNRNLWISGKTTGGFTINTDVAFAGVGQLFWMLVR